MCHLAERKGLAVEQHSTWSWFSERVEQRGQSGVEDGLGWPLAIDEFEHGKFTAVGEVFVGIRRGFPGYCVGDCCGPAMAFLKISILFRFACGRSAEWLC